jgi:protein SCO1/2
VLTAALTGCGASAQKRAHSATATSRGSRRVAGGSSTNLEGALLPAGTQARNFTLVDQGGERVSLGRWRGQVAILAFLYSTSKATATLIAQQVRGALNELEAPVPAIVVSVDPQADTPAHVKAFLQAAGLAGRVTYLTGSKAQLGRVWRAYRVVPASAGEGAYERGAFVAVLDRRGAERVEIPLEELTPEGLAQDVRRLQATESPAN